jgi:hypothetical protein
VVPILSAQLLGKIKEGTGAREVEVMPANVVSGKQNGSSSYDSLLNMVAI